MLLKNFDSTPRRLRPGTQVSASHGPEGPAPPACAHRRRRRRLHAVKLTLDKMARGGIYDHLGGGFARYSTDERWLVPHFEKMLYDNALLASVYLEAFQMTGDGRLRPGGPRNARLRPAPDDRATRAGSTRPRMPTARARRGSTTSGRWPRSTRSSVPDRGKTFRLRLRRHGSGQLGGHRTSSTCPRPIEPGGEAALPRRGRAERRAGRGPAPSCSPCAIAACPRPRTRRSWSRGTA